MKRKIIKKEMTLVEMKQKRAEINKTRLKKPHRRYTEVEYVRAIKACNGYKTEVADLLDVTLGAVCSRIKNSKRLQIVMDEISQKLIDLAELGLAEEVKDKKPWALQFVLRSKGRSRGWGERVDIDATIRPAGGVLQVPYQFESSEEWSKVTVEHQRRQQKLLEEGVDNDFSNDEDNDEEEEQQQQQYNFKGE